MSKSPTLTMSGERCKGCQGTRVQHLDEEGCWCARCLPKPVDERCRDWDPEPYTIGKTKKPVDRPVARVGRDHPETARSAAAKQLPRSGSLRRELFDLLRRRPMTDDELEQVTCKSHQTVSGGRNTLMNDGLIEDSGQRRATRYGNDAIVWQVTADAVNS